MGRERRAKGHDTNRDAGGFVALPWVVTDCPAYQSLSYPARALLIEIDRQYVRDNNGRLLASRAYLAKRGWKSVDTITRAVKELIEAKLIHQTVVGHFPKTASWYAVTWRTLDRIKGYDAGAAESFERGAYAKQPLKNASLRPTGGQERPTLAPPVGQGRTRIAPPNGTMKGVFGAFSCPPAGHHLDTPSPVPELNGNQGDGNYQRLTKPTDGRCWLPAGLVDREVVPKSVTRKATKQLPNLASCDTSKAIRAARSAGLTLEQLTGWADPQSVALALAAGNRPWLELWTMTADTTPTLETNP